MQTPKSKIGSLEIPQRTSPTTPRTAHKLKTPGSGSNSVSSSPHQASRTPKDQSPKVVVERRSPRSPITELQKKRPSRVSQLESQLTQLQEDLKKAKDQLSSSASCKRRAQQEAEEAKKQLSGMSAKLEESNQQLTEISTSEEARVQELRQISQDRDQAWQSELEAVQKQHSMDSAALASAMNEVQKLKRQLEMVAGSESVQAKHTDDEFLSLQQELGESLNMVEKLKNELSDCKESEAQTLEVLGNTKMQLETALATAHTLKLEALEANEAYDSLALELKQSKSQVQSLEGHVSKLQEDLQSGRGQSSTNTVLPSGDSETACQNGDNEEIEQLKTELNNLNFEVSQLRAALDAAKVKYQEEYMQSTLQIRSAYEQVELIKSESSMREAELKAELKKAKSNIDELKAKLTDQEARLQSMSEENEGLKSEKKQTSGKESELEMDLKKSEVDLANLKSSLLDKETELQSIMVQNEMLKREIQKKEIERTKENNDATALAEAARAAEREALMKVGYLTEEADKNSRRAARVMEQLDAAQTASSEMEAELRRLKVQSDQWRKAAEAAAAMLSTDNGKYMDRTRSLDSNYHTIGGKMNSPYSDDMEDESPKKRNGNMLKKIGVLWKKGQTQK